jgi:predicted metal-binding transcription factor (methanogenesis marker protein 9)
MKKPHRSQQKTFFLITLSKKDYLFLKKQMQKYRIDFSPFFR